MAQFNLATKQSLEAHAIQHGVKFLDRDSIDKRVQCANVRGEIRISLRVEESTVEQAKKALSTYLAGIKHSFKEVHNCYAFRGVKFVVFTLD